MSKVLDATCSSFQLTTSQGGRPLDNWWLDHIRCISTHDLTRRSTQKRLVSAVFRFISTHDLTRRSTTSTGSMSDNSLFQLTTSRGGRRKILAVQSQLVLTTSQGGRRQDRGRDQGYQRISTHDLARRSTQFFL